MILIYDFDGTLTPYSMPQYEVLKQSGYDDERLINKMDELSSQYKTMYNIYYKCYETILAENNIPMTKENICKGAKNVKYNKGVEEYFKYFQKDNTGIKHYVVTSGIQDYVEETTISKYLNGIYGSTYNKNGEVFENINFLLNDTKKVDIIKSIQEENGGTNEIIYFGDGLTDGCAFEYVHNIGGKSIFVLSNKSSVQSYEELNQKRNYR